MPALMRMQSAYGIAQTRKGVKQIRVRRIHPAPDIYPWPFQSEDSEVQVGIAIALLSAALFGASTPLAKILLRNVSPWAMAGLLYLGAGLGLAVIHCSRKALRLLVIEAPLRRSDLPWLAAVITAGGILGPLFLMFGLSRTDAAGASLLLNLEGLATMGIGVVGFLGYGVSLALFVLGLRHLGTARTGAYFSLAPFIGALLSLMLLGEPLTLRLLTAGALMAVGLWLHLTERHEHEHRHEAIEHEHRHTHDQHHRHAHGPDDPTGEPHSHWHRHEPLIHRHPHYPDLHHRHRH
jgi:drug/metabolite transporter (DMT)-like permease